MNYCLRGRELLLELKRSDWLPPFNDEGVRTLLLEIEEIQQKFSVLGAQHNIEGEEIPHPVKVTLAYYHQCIKRNHRYINSYLTHRLGKIRMLKWEAGAVLPDKIKHNTLSAREKEYFMAYGGVIADYSDQVGIDLSMDIEPPKDLQIQIRVLETCGKIMTENGPLDLQKGSTNFLRRTEVEQLIRDGKVEHVRNDEDIK